MRDTEWKSKSTRTNLISEKKYTKIVKVLLDFNKMIVNSKMNERAIEARGNQAPLELIFGEIPTFDDVLGKVASVIRTEQGLLEVT
jgi:hypothetical protein